MSVNSRVPALIQISLARAGADPPWRPVGQRGMAPTWPLRMCQASGKL